jgi:hypothetical protein
MGFFLHELGPWKCFFFFGLLKNNLADLELCDVLYKGSITVLDFILYSF